MKMRAAVLEDFGAPLEVQELELAEPRAGEVLVRLEACGVCHTDLYTASGADPSGYAPTVLGHEGAGVVERVGRRRAAGRARRPRGHALLAPVRRVHPLPQPEDQPVPGDPRAAEPGLPPGRNDTALPRRRADPPLHGNLDVRRIRGAARDRARERLAGGAARPGVPVRLRPLHRPRRGDVHRARGGRLDLRRVRGRDGGPGRRGGVPAPGRRADRVRRPLRRPAGARAAGRARRTCFGAGRTPWTGSWR